MASQGYAFYIGKVEGLDEVYRALDEFRPNLKDQLVERMESAAQDLAATINRKIPETPPLSEFGSHKGETSWERKGEASISPQGSRAGAAAQEWPLYRVSLGGYASAVTDIAGAGGRGNSMQGTNMIGMLNSRVGRASRWVWPSAEAHESRIERNMTETCRKVEDEVSRRLAARASAASGA